MGEQLRAGQPGWKSGAAAGVGVAGKLDGFEDAGELGVGGARRGSPVSAAGERGVRFCRARGSKGKRKKKWGVFPSLQVAI